MMASRRGEAATAADEDSTERSWPRAQLQFHADAPELIRIANEWADRHGLHMAAEQFFPYAAVSVQAKLEPEPLALDQIDRVWVGFRRFSVDHARSNRFAESVSDSLAFTVGGYHEGGLRESAVGAVKSDGEALALWKRLLRQLRTSLHKGATVRSPYGGRTLSRPSHRHTDGAHRLAESGIRMLAVAGWNEYEFDDVARGRQRPG